MDKSILEVVYESSKELRDAEVMDEVIMRELEALCLSPVKSYTPTQIQRNPKSAQKS